MLTRNLKLVVAVSSVVAFVAFVWQTLHPLPYFSLVQNFQDFYAYLLHSA